MLEILFTECLIREQFELMYAELYEVKRPRDLWLKTKLNCWWHLHKFPCFPPCLSSPLKKTCPRLNPKVLKNSQVPISVSSMKEQLMQCPLRAEAHEEAGRGTQPVLRRCQCPPRASGKDTSKKETGMKWFLNGSEHQLGSKICCSRRSEWI